MLDIAGAILIVVGLILTGWLGLFFIGAAARDKAKYGLIDDDGQQGCGLVLLIGAIVTAACIVIFN